MKPLANPPMKQRRGWELIGYAHNYVLAGSHSRHSRGSKRKALHQSSGSSSR
jgi:hypothetical protein